MIGKIDEKLASSGEILKRLLLITTVIVFLVVGVACDYFQQEKKNTEIDVLNENLPYEYTDPELDIDPTRELYFDIDYKLDNTLPYFNSIEVFWDPGLKIKAEDAEIDFEKGRFVVRPRLLTFSDKISNEEEYFVNSHKWGFSDEYFVVRKNDPKSGKLLEKPLVTRFTVKTAIEKPAVSFSVDDKGIGHFVWEPVDNVKKYYIIKIDHISIEIIGATEKTEWTTIEQDKYSSEKENVYLGTQNNLFQNFSLSEDYIDSMEVEPQEQKDIENFYGIIASDYINISPFSLIYGSSIESRLPYEIATNAYRKMKAHRGYIEKFDDIPTHLPITMTDGTTMLRPVVIDVNNITIGNTIDNTKACFIPYTVGGTVFNGTFNCSKYSPETYKSEVQRIVTRNEQAVIKTGESLVYTYTTEKKDLSNVEISSTEPSVPYKINATNNLTRYIAANMIVGNQYIDVSKHLYDWNGISVTDAANEAMSQNPYILGVNKLNYIKGQKVLEVEYIFGTGEERVKFQKAAYDEVNRVVTSIITEGMTDLQKIKAINDYIISTAEYDYDAKDAILADEAKEVKEYYGKFKYAWNLAGVLIYKKAVCSGYAKAFKALADEAGLESVYVTGVVEGYGHAWNKVKVNGVWRLIDVTWNDSKSNLNGYYLITDKETLEKRLQIQDNSFVIDPLIYNYATN